MTKSEALRRFKQGETLRSLGFTQAEADSLRRISMTLHRWHELECGTDEGGGSGQHVSVSVERDGDEPDSKPFKRIQYQGAYEWVDKRWAIPDRETGAKKRLKRIIMERNQRALVDAPDPDTLEAEIAQAFDLSLSAYIQTDPRGAALYILRPGDVPEGEDVSSYYSRGICVY